MGSSPSQPSATDANDTTKTNDKAMGSSEPELKASSPLKEGGIGSSSSFLNSSSISAIEAEMDGTEGTFRDNYYARTFMPSMHGGGDPSIREVQEDPVLASASAVSPRRKSKNVSASTSFDERFKYKISIYSKVSGCRMANLPDYTIVKQVRVVALQYVTGGDPHAVLGIKFAYEKMKNGGLQVITDDARLSAAMGRLSYFATIPCKMTFPDNPRVVGFVKDLPLNMEPAELKREIRKDLPEVYSVRYIKERFGGQGRMQKPCAFVSFNLRYLPGSIRVFQKEYEILVPNPMQCTRCCRYGHQGKQCQAETRCPLCGKPHAKYNCGSQTYRCVNCKGAHPSTSHECTVWKQGKLMNELRYRGGLTAEEAIDVASNGTIQHKKHNFTSPDEYFDALESFYLGSGSGDASRSSDGHESSSTGQLASSFVSNGQSEDHDLTIGTNHLDATFVDENVVFHPEFIAAQEYLDTVTDFYLKLTNPTKKYKSSILMPGFEEDSVRQRLSSTKSKKPSLIAQQFKLSVLQAFEEDEQRKRIETVASSEIITVEE